MQIRSAVFFRGVVGPAADPDRDPLAGMPHVALVGRSNVGKSSTINALTGVKGLARSSAVPGKTRELNVYLVNKEFLLVDLPGYGFSASSKQQAGVQQDRIGWYLFQSAYVPAIVVVLLDAKIGPSAQDREVINAIEERGHPLLLVANKSDKLGPNALKERLASLQAEFGHPALPLSATKNTGVGRLREELGRMLRERARA